MPNCKITTLVENTVTAGLSPLIAEHGLSFFVETPDNTILFDTGQGLAIGNNARALGIDLTKVDTLVLSHAHFDHGGGLKNVLEKNSSFKLIAHPEIYEEKFVGSVEQCFPIGVEKDIPLLEKSDVRFEISKESVQIAPGVMTTGLIPLEVDFESVEPMFYKERNNTKVPDLIEDDKAMVIDTPKGLVVVLGCAHRGIINTLNHVTALTGQDKIHAIMGGLHLMSADDEKMKKINQCFMDFGIEKFIVGHCTGFHAIKTMSNTFGDRLIPNSVGVVVEF